MNATEHLVQDLRAHAPEAPAVCAALMRRAATELERGAAIGPFARDAAGSQTCPKEAAHADR